MTLSHGRNYLAIPGPSVVPDRVLREMHRSSPNIYAGALVEAMPSLMTDLKAAVGTRHHGTIYISNGHGAWEAALSNVLNEGDKTLSLCTGRFGFGWAEMAQGLGVDPEIYDFGNRSAVDPSRVEERLRADKSHEIKAVLLTHVDTATSVKNDVEAVRAAMDAADHPALLMVDCIASFGADRFEMDAWGVDVTVGASQKGMMMPPGLGFVFFNEKAAEVRRQKKRVSGYWDWTKRAAPEQFYEYFGGTPPTQHLYGLRASLDIIAEEGGMSCVWARHDHLARAIWAALDAWGEDGSIEMNIANPAQRSSAVTAIRMAAPDATRLREWTEEKTGVTLGIGLGMADSKDPAWHGFFRIGHMGHVNAHMVMGVLASIEAGFRALDIAHGHGALDAAARIISEA